MSRDSVPEASSPAAVIEAFQHDAGRQWDEFVMGHPLGSPFHLTAWRATVEQSFGFEPRYLLAREGRRVAGVLPLFFVKNRLMGKVLISSPFAVYGGILAESAGAARALYGYVKALGAQLRVEHIELRNGWLEQCVGESNVARYATFTQKLLPDEEATLAALPKKTRNLVRKALKTPFNMRYGVKDLTNFAALYSENMRRLGSPCFPARYFYRLLANFGNMVDVREVWLDGRVMAVSLNFLFRDQMHIYYAAADTRYNSLGPNTYMYFDHLRWAGRNGYKTFDFGRAKRNTGSFEFKRHWNPTERPLPYEIILGRRKELPNFSPTNPRFEAAIKIWRRVPLPLTRMLGPRLVRFFP